MRSRSPENDTSDILRDKSSRIRETRQAENYKDVMLEISAKIEKRLAQSRLSAVVS